MSKYRVSCLIFGWHDNLLFGRNHVFSVNNIRTYENVHLGENILLFCKFHIQWSYEKKLVWCFSEIPRSPLIRPRLVYTLNVLFLPVWYLFNLKSFKRLKAQKEGGRGYLSSNVTMVINMKSWLVRLTGWTLIVIMVIQRITQQALFISHVLYWPELLIHSGTRPTLLSFKHICFLVMNPKYKASKHMEHLVLGEDRLVGLVLFFRGPNLWSLPHPFPLGTDNNNPMEHPWHNIGSLSGSS